ncbi:hypothetical protein ACIOBK_33890 [Micromonospora chokoriensis]
MAVRASVRKSLAESVVRFCTSQVRAASTVLTKSLGVSMVSCQRDVSPTRGGGPIPWRLKLTAALGREIAEVAACFNALDATSASEIAFSIIGRIVPVDDLRSH